MIGQGGVSAVAGGAQGDYPQYHGIFYGAVSNNADPLKKNRCLLRVPQLLGSAVTTWALPLTPLVDPPAVGTLVAVMFTGGDLDNPVYLVVYPSVPIENVNANVQPVGTTSSAGSSHKVAAADHVHTLANALESTAGNIQPVGSSSAAGTSVKASRGDHVHSGLPAGSAGFLEIGSSKVNSGDTQSTIDMFSRLAGAPSEIDLNATSIFLNGKTTISDVIVVNVPSGSNPNGGNTSYSIAGQNTISSPGASYSQTWAQQVQATVGVLFGAFNALQSSFVTLYTGVDAMWNNIYS